MKRLLLIVSLVFVLVLPAYSEEYVCVVTDQAKQIVVDLESCRLRIDQIINLQKQIDEYKAQIEIYKEREELFAKKEELYKQIIALQKQQVELAEDTIKKLKSHTEFIQETYQKALEASKPNLFLEIVKIVSFVGLGVLIGVIIP